MAGNDNKLAMRRLRMWHRRRSMLKDIRDGFDSVLELAKKYNVSRKTVRRDVIALQEWLHNDIDKQIRRDKEMAIERLNAIMRKALDSYNRSLEDEEKIKVTENRVECKKCQGTGEVDDEYACPLCAGTGAREFDTKTIERKGQAGDASHLRVILDCMKELNKMLGHLAPTRIEKPDTPASQTLIVAKGDVAAMSTDEIINAKIMDEGDDNILTEPPRMDAVEIEQRMLEDDSIE